MRDKLLPTVLVLVTAGLTLACGGGGTATPAATSTPTVIPTAVTTQTASATASAPAVGVALTPNAEGEVEVYANDAFFSGEDTSQGAAGKELLIEAKAGDLKIEVENSGKLMHTLHITSPIDKVTKNLAAGDKDVLTLIGLEPGEYKFICDFHPTQMVGRDRKSTRLNSSHIQKSRMPSSA